MSRERDPSQRIEAVVRSAARRHDLVRAGEGLLVGLFAGVATSAAALLSGAAPLDGGPLAAAALAGLFGAASWWGERRKTRADLVRRVDRATLGAEPGGESGGEPGPELGAGALVTAFEITGRPAPNPLEAVLVERAAQAVDPRAARRAIPPPAVALVALPLAAAALLAFLIETRAPGAAQPAPGGGLAALSAALSTAAASAPSGGLDSELEQLLDRALELAARPGQSAALDRALAELEGALEQRAALSEGERAEELTRGASLARAARGPGRRGRPDPGGGSTGAAETGSGGDSGGPGLASGPSGSTMVGSPEASEVPGDPAGGASTSGPAAEAGVVAGQYWDAQYDGVVAGWVLRSGAARSGERNSE